MKPRRLARAISFLIDASLRSISGASPLSGFLVSAIFVFAVRPPSPLSSSCPSPERASQPAVPTHLAPPASRCCSWQGRFVAVSCSRAVASRERSIDRRPCRQRPIARQIARARSGSRHFE